MLMSVWVLSRTKGRIRNVQDLLGQSLWRIKAGLQGWSDSRRRGAWKEGGAGRGLDCRIVLRSSRQADEETQSIDRPLEKSCIGQQWPMPVPTSPQSLAEISGAQTLPVKTTVGPQGGVYSPQQVVLWREVWLVHFHGHHIYISIYGSSNVQCFH